MKGLYLTILILCSFSMLAQDKWQDHAKSFLSCANDPSLDPFDLEAALFRQLTLEYEADKLDKYLTHYLAISEAGTEFFISDEILQAALREFEDDPIQQVNLIMDYCSHSNYEDNTNTQKLLDRALQILEIEEMQGSRLYMNVLADYTSLYRFPIASEKPVELLKNSLKICEQKFGQESTIYIGLLNSLASTFDERGELEDFNKYSALSNRLTTLTSGVNKLKEEMFENAEVVLVTDGFPTEVQDRILMAKLFGGFDHEYFEWLPKTRYSQHTAVQLYEQSVELMGESSGTMMAHLLFTTGNWHLKLRNFDKATQYLRRAFNMFKEQLNSDIIPHYLNSYMQLGCAYYGNGQSKQAFDIFKNLDEWLINNEMQYMGLRFSVVHNLILTGHKIKDVESVKHYTGLGLTPDSNYELVLEQIPELWYKYGRINQELGLVQSGHRYLVKAYDEKWNLAMERGRLDNESLSSDYSEDFDQGNTMSPYEYSVFQERLDIGATEVSSELFAGKPEGENYLELVFDLIKSSISMRKFDESAKYALEFINEFYTQINDPYQEHETARLQEIYYLKEKLFPVYDLYQNAVLHDSLFSIEMQKESRMRAFNQVLDSKSNVQLEYRQMIRKILNSKDKELKFTYKTYLDKRKELSMSKMSASGESEGIEIQLNQLLNELSSMLSEFKRPEEKFVFWTDVKSQLKKNEAAIEIKRVQEHDGYKFTGKIFYVAYILKADSEYPERVVFRNGQDMEGSSLSFYQNAIKYKIENTRSYDVYWKPLKPFLEGIKRVYFSPDGVYNKLSVNTLFNTETSTYVQEEIRVFNVISSKQLNTEPKELTKIKRATLIGRPSYQIESLDEKEGLPLKEESRERALTRAQITNGVIADLPGTEVEIKNIKKVLAKHKVKSEIFLGPNSTEEQFKKAQSELLHVATHGFWFKANSNDQADAMFQSGLLFAGVKNYAESGVIDTDDGILTAYEIQGMNLENTELVVLSACETALGQVENGEGVYGLQRALTIAGVDKLIMSLWKVDDQATQELFSTFYSNWIGRGKEIYESFNLAQAMVREKYSHPYYWGAFILID